MRVAVVGTRGMPGVHGGVERHCEELYPRLVEQGIDVTVYARRVYVNRDQVHCGVEVVVLDAAGGKGVEAFTHTAAAIRRAQHDGCDILHVHSIGPASLIPYARALGHRRVISTLHAPDYAQAKWGPAARSLLRFGERQAALGSDRAICVSEWYSDYLEKRYARRPVTIPNGPGMTAASPGPSVPAIGTTDRPYLLFVGRLIPDKRVEDLLRAAQAVGPSIHVVVVGDSSDTSEYAETLRTLAGPTVRFTGYLHGDELVEAYRGAAALVLPSAVEGLPICLLEAMSMGVPVIASDIPANREALDGGACGHLFPAGDVEALAEAIRQLDSAGTERRRVAALERVDAMYDWDAIAGRTLAVYRELI